ncbi:hypothetical protein DPMN_115738 [Dreissena polymorpha]|uniref:Uncharacterized protein n=1 Tax=Dreissena polymorpha TaxID=45954 RepID=A0A9D4KM96_DREPO|nr:hypothetical protein DPMN_115738 [Dreissena polymorpha]
MKQDLQRLLSIRNGSRTIIAHKLEELPTTIDENDRDSMKMILNNISEVSDSLKAIDEKILSQTEVERIPEETMGTATYTNQLKRKLQKLKKEFISTDRNNKTVDLPGLPSASATTDESPLVLQESAEAPYELSPNSTAYEPYGLQPTSVDVVTGQPQNSATIADFCHIASLASTKFRNRTIREIDDFRHSANLGTPDVLDHTF